jgi:hypothetical protein
MFFYDIQNYRADHTSQQSINSILKILNNLVFGYTELHREKR